MLPRFQLMSFAAASGALAGLGHAPFHLWPVSLVGFAALTYLVARHGRPALAGWCGGVGYFAITLHWIIEPFLVDIARHGWMAPFALVLMAGGLALFWGLAGWVSRFGAQLQPLVWALALGCAEFARGHVFTGFPWALPAYIWADTPLIMASAYVGPYGLSALTLLVTALPFLGARLWLGAIPMAIVALSALTLSLPEASFEPAPKTVRLVQPNALQHEKWDPEKAHIFVERLIEFTAAPKDDLDIILWPETAIPYRLQNATPVLAQISAAAQGVPVVTGINRINDGLFHNSLISVGSTGQPTEIYDKVHLVPFGEYIPFGQLARIIGMRSFAARDGYGFSAGEGVRAIETPLGRALPLICYEAIFPGHGRDLADRPDFIMQITNDAWFGTFSGPFQHLDQARFRAVEQGLPLVRAANTGVSAVIAPNGEITEMLGLGEAGFLDAAMPNAVSPTLYRQIGDIPALALMIVALCALLLLARRNTIAMSVRKR